MIEKKYLEIIKKIGIVGKDATNPFTESKYSSLTNILNKVQPLLNEDGLILKFDFPVLENDNYTVKAKLIDTEGDSKAFMEWDFTIPHDQTQKNKTQGFGSTMTYGQRYMYAIIFQIPFDDQDPDAKAGKDQKKDQEKENGEEKPWLNPDTKEYESAKKYMIEGGNVSKIREKYKVSKKLADKLVEHANKAYDQTPEKEKADGAGKS